MSIKNRSVFKVVILRGSLKGLSSAQNEFLDTKTQTPNRFPNFEFKPSFPTDQVKRILDFQHRLDEITPQYLSIHAPSKSDDELSNSENETLSLKALPVISLINLNLSLSDYKAHHPVNH